jgi:hypothetical protein
MKPNSQPSRQSDRRNDERSSFRFGSNHPLIDYQFRTSLGERELGGTGASHKQPVFAAFRALSDKFFQTEAKQDYILEVLFFAIMVAISAWPIASMMQALGMLSK